ncbi:expressed unknown protein [Seminavis robusta]|uniref:Uncharacterized protein n=1 Tax=Seminavis robusta TaxID=568900 RepID=A0A9N8HAH5_9STRA|nr:expressed unknown protein [Seminavis robusta]|eukprot:Sro148_g068270.1 n/a (97) ;mRNA; r:93636-93994
MYALYGQEGGVPERQIQWAACSGAPGLGKTTFCRKAFTKSIHSLQGELRWRCAMDGCANEEGVSPSGWSKRVLKQTGRQYQISFGGSVPGDRPRAP